MMSSQAPIEQSFCRLNSIEKFHYFDANARFPNWIYCRLLVDKIIDPELARLAWNFVGQRHPLFGASIERVDKRLTWVRLNKQAPLADEEIGSNRPTPSEGLFFDPFSHFDATKTGVAATDDSISFHLRPSLGLGPFATVRNVPSRVSCENETDSPVDSIFSEIWFTIHHAICDGAGAVLMINEWLQVYDNLRVGRDPLDRVISTNKEGFGRRNQLGLLRWKYFKNLPFQSVGLFGAFKFVFRKTANLESLNGATHAESKNFEKRPTAQPTFIGGWIEPTMLDGLTEISERHQVSLNAILLTSLFAAIERWRSRVDIDARVNDWIRIILPMNIRDISHRKMPAANRTSIVQIDRRRLSDPVSLESCRSIDHEINVIRNWQLDRMFLVMIRGLSIFEPLLKHVANNQKPRGISVFTNLGQPLRRYEKARRINQHADLTINAALPNTRLETVEVDFMGPLRAGTPFNFAVARFGERLRVTLHYDPAVVSQSSARELLDEYTNSLRSIPPSLPVR